MGSLSNLYISQSFQSLIHLGNDISASTTQVELEDGFGNGLGIYVNTLGDVSIDGKLVVSGTFDIEGKITVNDDVRVNGNLSVSGATSLTGSLDVTQNITASNGLIENDLIVSGTLFANKVVTTIESASIIYSSGSNILGDEVSDTQTLIGSTIMSGSASLTGSMGISNNISSSTISGIGNVTLYSQSVDSRLVYLEVPFSTSVDARIDALEDFSSSTFNAFSISVDSRLDYLETTFSTSVDSRLDIVEATASLYIPFSTSVDSRLDLVESTSSYLNTTFSSSVDNRLDNLEAFSSSLVADFATQTELTLTASILQSNINTKLDTSSFNAYTQSYSSSVATINFAQDVRLNTLSSFTGSYATTGSNTFIGNEVFSGSIRGNVIPITIASSTASMDCSLGNFFTLTLASGTNTRLVATNIQPGETISLRVTQAATTGSISYPSYIKFPNFSAYSASLVSNAVDIVSFISFDSSILYGVNVKNMI